MSHWRDGTRVGSVKRSMIIAFGIPFTFIVKVCSFPLVVGYGPEACAWSCFLSTFTVVSAVEINEARRGEQFGNMYVCSIEHGVLQTRQL